MNADPFRSVGASNSVEVAADLRSKLSAVQVYQRIMREWAKHLTIYELLLALMIADRTIGWRKTRATFSSVKLREGDKLYSGLPMGRTAMFSALASLEAKGIIKRFPVSGKDIRSYSINIGWSPSKSGSLKGSKSPSAMRTTPFVIRTTPVRQADTGEGNHGEVIHEKVIPAVSAQAPRPVVSEVEKVREQIGAASAASRSARAAKTQTLPDRVAGIENAFRMAIEEAHPAAVYAVWSVREKAKLKAKLKTWVVKDGGFPEFVDWAVRNWSAIVRKQFRWMTRSPAPAIPEIGFLLSFMGHFLECRAEGKLGEWLASPERSQYEKLTARGLSAEEAAAEIGKRRAVEAMREENETVRIEARARVRRAEIIEKRTEVMANLPSHPDSEFARKARGELTSGPIISLKEPEPIDWINQPVLDPNWEPPL